MSQNGITIAPALEADMPVIEQLAIGFDLDCENISYPQFIAVKKKRDSDRIREAAQISGMH